MADPIRVPVPPAVIRAPRITAESSDSESVRVVGCLCNARARPKVAVFRQDPQHLSPMPLGTWIVWATSWPASRPEGPSRFLSSAGLNLRTICSDESVIVAIKDMGCPPEALFRRGCLFPLVGTSGILRS